MSAFDTPWMTSMSSVAERDKDGVPQSNREPATVATFSPTSSFNPALGKQRSTILVHQKSPLLVATPPQITRALAYSHPFLSPLNRLLGLITWTTRDPWESFLMVMAYWFTVLYGDIVIIYAAPILLVVALMCGMYFRRFSPLSSASWTSITEQHHRGHSRKESESKVRHQKSLDEIVETLKMFTSRCNILLDPLVRLTDFLSTQSSPTSATTRPALTTLFIRILFLAPIWIILSSPPLRIITTRRVALSAGTAVLTYHSRPARVTRTILWRSLSVRKFSAFVTGLPLFDDMNSASSSGSPTAQPGNANVTGAASALAAASTSKQNAEGIRFTFTLYENQRRWIGIGWTSSMLAYERAPWTDEELNAAPPKDQFELPDVEGGVAEWRWVEDSKWEVEGMETDDEDEDGNSASKTKADGGGSASQKKRSKLQGDAGWMYYDNKWQGGRYGQDGWGKYTRRRKWCRDAELIEVSPIPTPRATSEADSHTRTTSYIDFSTTPARSPSSIKKRGGAARSAAAADDDAATLSSSYSSSIAARSVSTASNSASSSSTRRSWFARTRKSSNVSRVSNATDDSGCSTAVDDAASTSGGSFSFAVDRGDDDDDNTAYLPSHLRGKSHALETEWGVGDDLGMDLG